jgi:uncharacterized Zn-finger protein
VIGRPRRSAKTPQVILPAESCELQQQRNGVNVCLVANRRIYSCTFCDRVFGSTSNLNRHIRIHTNERPYACSVCSKAFANSSNRWKHEKRCAALEAKAIHAETELAAPKAVPAPTSATATATAPAPA